jgi:hypothetical protein
MKHVTASLTIASCLLLVAAGTAFARPGGPTTSPQQTPTTGQHGSNLGPSNSCGAPGSSTPGAAGAASNPGSPFNGTPGSSGQAGNVYAGNSGTASLANSNSTATVSQYDVACFRP